MFFNEDNDSAAFESPVRITGVWRLIILAVVGGCVMSAAFGSDICIRNGVQCHRKLIPIPNSSHHRVVYEPVVKVVEQVRVVVEQPAPIPYPDARDLLEYDENKFDDALIQIIGKAQRDKDRRAILRELGIRLDDGAKYPADRSVYSRDVYNRPAESSYGISVKESVDYVGSDPTDVIAGQIGRQMDRVGDLFGDLAGGQSRALQTLITSRGVNTERIARAIERQAEASGDATKIRAIGDVVKRTHVDRETTIAGTFLQALQQALGGAVSSTATPLSSSADNIQTALTTKCGACHDPNSQTYIAGRMDLSNYTALNGQQWAAIIKNVRGGTMPPTGSPALTADEERFLVDYFVSETLKGD